MNSPILSVFPLLFQLVGANAASAQVPPAASASPDPGAHPSADAAPVPQPAAAAQPAATPQSAAAAEAPSTAPQPAIQAELGAPVAAAVADVPAAPAAHQAPTSPPAVAPSEKADDLSVEPSSIQFKPGKGLLFESRDGRFGMAIRSRIQLRHTYEHLPESQLEEGEEASSHLLNVRRARFQIAGHFFGKHNKYKLQLALSPSDMNLGVPSAPRSPVLDALLEFDYLRDATVTAGQFMVPWNRQRVASSGDFELVDRSIAGGEFQLDRDIGVQISSNDLMGLGYLRYYGGIFNGEGRDDNVLGDAGLLYVARVEVLPTGDSKNRWDYEEGDLERSKVPRVSLGAAYAYEDNALRNRGVMGSIPTDGGTTDMHVVTGDFVVQWAGVSLTSEIYWRQAERNYGDATTIDDDGNVIPAVQEAARNGMGWFVQAGYILPWAPVGVAARYSALSPSDSDSSMKEVHEIGGGPSWYFGGHDFKIQLDYFRQFATDISVGSDTVRTQLTAGF